MSVESRLDFIKASPLAFQAMMGLESYIEKCDLDPLLIKLIKIRASQINKCSFCIDMHVTEAKKKGESEVRLHQIAVWPESPFFSDKEKAVLAFTESVTKIDIEGVTQEKYDLLKKYFSDKEIIDMTMCLSAINAWNRFCVTFKTVPMSYLK